MSNRIVSTVVFAVLVFAAAQQSAAQTGDSGGFYAGASLGSLSFDWIEDYDGSVLALNGRLGMYFNEYLSGELRLGLGLGDDEFTYTETFTIGSITETFTVEIGSVIGLYGRLGLPLENIPLMPYAVLGFSRVSSTISLEEESEDFSGTGLSFGIGVDWILEGMEGFRLNAEFTRYNNIEDDEGDEVQTGIQQFSAGFTYDF